MATRNVATQTMVLIKWKQGIGCFWKLTKSQTILSIQKRISSGIQSIVHVDRIKSTLNKSHAWKNRWVRFTLNERRREVNVLREICDVKYWQESVMHGCSPVFCWLNRHDASDWCDSLSLRLKILNSIPTFQILHHPSNLFDIFFHDCLTKINVMWLDGN